MGDIIKFPTKAVQGWAEIERTFREILKQVPAQPDMIDTLLERMKEFYLLFTPEFTFSFELPSFFSSEELEAISTSFRNAVKEHEKHLHDFTNQLFLERWQLEVELYKLRQTKP